jgi:hypothetical protein
VRSARDSSGFQSSLDLLREEEERFIKADPTARAIRELGEMFAAAAAYQQNHEVLRATSIRRTPMSAGWRDTFAKAMPKPEPKRVTAVKAHPAPVREVDLVAKAASLLYSGEGLTAEQRGNLLLGVSAAHDRAVFAKAARVDRHPVAGQIEAIRGQLEQAQRERDLGSAGPAVEEALRTIRNGIVDADDSRRLEYLLLEIRRQLAAGDTDIGTGDAR